MAIPRMILDCVNLPGLRAVPIWLGEQRFRRWKKRNPDGSFADFYIADAERKLGKGGRHSTLGGRGWTARWSGEVDWDSISFANRGLVNWRQILDLGLDPGMRCVDFGCGSLRLGQHAIRYLAPSNYWGIDLTDTFMDVGMRLLPADLVGSRKPRFGVIAEPLLVQIRAWQPDFIFANAVLQHVPPAELPLFFQRIAAMMTAGTRAYILYVSAPRLRRIKAVSWAYPPTLLEEQARVAAPDFHVRTVGAQAAYDRIAGGGRMILCIEPRAGKVNRI